MNNVHEETCPRTDGKVRPFTLQTTCPHSVTQCMPRGSRSASSPPRTGNRAATGGSPRKISKRPNRPPRGKTRFNFKRPQRPRTSSVSGTHPHTDSPDPHEQLSFRSSFLTRYLHDDQDVDFCSAGAAARSSYGEVRFREKVKVLDSVLPLWGKKVKN